jgi:hypothetical protein
MIHGGRVNTTQVRYVQRPYREDRERASHRPEGLRVSALVREGSGEEEIPEKRHKE